RGKPPTLKPTQEAHLVKLWRRGEHTTLELAELFSVSRATVYRAIQRGGAGTHDKTTRSRGYGQRLPVGRTFRLPRIGAVTSSKKRRLGARDGAAVGRTRRSCSAAVEVTQ